MMLNDDDDMEEVNCPQVNDTTTKTRRASIVWIILLQTWMMLLISRLLVVKPSTQVLVVVAAAFDRICFLQLLQIWVIESVVCVVCTLIYFCCSGCWLPDWLTDCWESRWWSWLTLPCHVFLSGKLLLFRVGHLCCMRITDHSGEFILYSREQERITKWDQELMVVQLELLLGERIKITLREVRRSAALISIIFCLIN